MLWECALSFGCSAWLYSLVGWLTLVIWKEVATHSYFLRHVALNVWCWMTQCWSVRRHFPSNRKHLKDNVIGATHTHTHTLQPTNGNTWACVVSEAVAAPADSVVLHVPDSSVTYSIMYNSLGDQLKLARKKLHNRHSFSKGRVYILTGFLVYWIPQGKTKLRDNGLHLSYSWRSFC